MEIHADSLRVYPPGGEVRDYWGNPWDSIRFDPFLGLGLMSEFLLIIPYLLSVAAIGNRVLNVLALSQRMQSNLASLAGGFLIGYVLVLPVIRLVFFVFPVSSAAGVSFAGVLFGGVLSAKNLTLRRNRFPIGITIKPIVVLGVLTMVSFVYRIQSGRNFLVSDSLITFLDQIRAIKQAPMFGYLPSWNQQSDEWVFSSPGIFLTQRVGAEVLWMLSTNALAFVALIVVLGNTADRILVGRSQSRIVRWSAILFVVLGTTATLPVLNISLIGGQNPLVYLGHAGRYVGIVAPLLGIALGVYWRYAPQRQLPLLSILSMGFAFLSPQTFFYFLIAIALGVLIGSYREGQSLAIHVAPNLGMRLSLVLLPPLSIALGLFVYSRTPPPAPAGTTQGTTTLVPAAILLFLPLVLMLAWVILRGALQHERHVLKGLLVPVSALCGVTVPSFVLGLLLSGNLIGDSRIRQGFASALHFLLPGIATPLLSRGINVPFALSALGQYGGLQCWISTHCSSSSGFALSVGFPLLLASFGVALTMATYEHRAQILGFATASLAVILLSAFFLTDFTGGDQLIYVWGKTRFLEAPLYLLMFMSIVVVGRSLPILTAVIAALWAVPTVIILIPQFFENLLWLIGRVV